MADRRPTYPFVPRSNAHLEPGQLWAIPLVTGRFACGRVLGVDRTLRHGGRTAFWAGLMDWCGDAPPTGDDLEGVDGVVHHGVAHILAITMTGGEILGHRPLVVDGIDLDGPWPEGALGYSVLRVRAEARWGDVEEYRRRRATTTETT